MREAKGSRCEKFRRDLSGFADRTLSPRRWQQVGYHVAGCEGCRAEVAEIRSICAHLQERATLGAVAPSTLAHRLQGIAGEESDAPLYISSGATSGLPTAHEQRKRRLAQGSVAMVTVAATLFAICILLAPEPARVANPLRQARTDYSLGVTAISVNQSLGAVLLAHSRGAELPAPVDAGGRSSILTSWGPMARDEAAAMLAPSVGQDLTFSGIHRISISNGEGQYWRTDVSVDQVQGTGANLSVLDAAGETFSSWFVPPHSNGYGVAPESWEFRIYDGMEQVAGRWARVLEATDTSGVPVSRWWLDIGSGLLLWSERYDAFGEPVVMGGFIHLDMTRASLRATNAELLLAHSVGSGGAVGDRSWCQGIPECPVTLAGLPLVGHTSSQAHGLSSMRLIYSDGFRNLTVQWNEGVWDSEELVSSRIHGMPDVQAWQAGDGVISVATNGGLALLDEATRELPPPQAYEKAVWDRARDGLARIVGLQ